MSYRDRDPRSFRSDPYGRSDPLGRPDQYGQEHYGRRQYGQPPGAQSAQDQRPGWQQQRDPDQQRSWDQHRNRQQGDDANAGRARHQDWRGSEARDDFLGRESQEWQARTARDPSYFGTGTQGYGGGPSFTGGNFGHADWRSDAPYFDEVGFNRGRSERRYPQGPKGYTRSDERIREDISERLMQSYDIDSSDVTVQVQGGKVALEGTVPSRYMKHSIEDIADAAAGVQDVDNRIRVTSSGARWGGNEDAGALGQTANNPVASAGGSATSAGSPASAMTSNNGRSGSTIRRDS